MRNAQYANLNQGAGWDDKYKGTGSKTNFQDIEVIEYKVNGRTIVELHYFGSTATTSLATTAAPLLNTTFPIGTLLISHKDGGILVKIQNTGTGDWKPVTLGTAV